MQYRNPASTYYGIVTNFMKKLIFLVLILIIIFFVVDVGRYFIFPDVASLKKNKLQKTAFMKYREQAWQKKGIKKKIRASWVPLSRISPYATKAIIIAEDDKFWTHDGFDFAAMQKALQRDIKKKKFLVGGSTISQQLAKNLYLTPSKNPIRKLKEAILTWRLEEHLSKRRIIELYLNAAEWGDGIFGIEAAAQNHFGKHASDLNPHEAAALAAILPNPRRYRPDGTSRYVENRAEKIYSIMLRRGIVIPEYEEVAQNADDESVAAVSEQKQEESSVEDKNMTNIEVEK